MNIIFNMKIKKDNLYFVKGELAEAIESGLPIELQNAPWDDVKFQRFWRLAFLKGNIEHEGAYFVIPSSLQLFRSQGYQWKELTQQVLFDTKLSADSLALNPGCLSDFFNRYACDNETETLDTLPGLIEEHAGQNLDVNLTRALSLDEWALFLARCQKHKVKVNIHCSPSVKLPTELSAVLDSTLQPSEPLPPKEHTQVIKSTDLDTTLSQLTTKDEWKILTIDECEANDLLLRTDASYHEKTGQIRFNQTKAVLLIALGQKEKVILKGRFTPELIDSLTPLLLERQKNQNVKGQLVLLSENEDFNYLATQFHQVSSTEKRDSLTINYSLAEIEALDEKTINEESLSELKARLNYLRIHPKGDSTKAWQGIYTLPNKISLPAFDAANSERLANEFEQNRLIDVNKVFKQSPYVCLTGITGTGKTTFIDKVLTADNTVIYKGEEQMLQWALDSSKQRKLLFIDEANLSTRQWSELEGLLNTPPGIVINGKYYPLTEEHKVALAFNPLSYGDERQIAPFIKRHGNAIVFEPMPQEYIYERILKPIFQGTALEEQTLELCIPILEIYRFLCECSETEILISARELQMMALLVLSHYQQKLELDKSVLAAKRYAYQLAANLVPDNHRAQLEHRFNPEFKTKAAAFSNQVLNGNFLLTQSRQPLSSLLEDLLKLREFRQSLAATNEGQRYGGLGGLIIEGNPASGKNAFVSTFLIEQGFVELKEKAEEKGDDPLPEKGYYRIPASMQTEDKKRLILKAFHGGHGIIMPNINSSPMMERFLNSLLMGTTPDGERPDNPGFFVIGLQHSIAMGGRRAPSNALARRLITIKLPEYSHQERKDILTFKGLSSKKAELLSTLYEKNVKKAQQEHLSPPPTLKNLMRLAEQILKDKKEKEGIAPFSKERIIHKLEVHIAKQRTLDRSHSFFSSKEVAQLTAAEKLLEFLQEGEIAEPLSSEERDALNKGYLATLVKELDQEKLLEGTDFNIHLTKNIF